MNGRKINGVEISSGEGGDWVERRKRINNGLALGGLEAFFEGKGKGEMQ